MIKVGAFEAKTHLASLLEKVSHGEEVLITRRGKAIARLVPAENASKEKSRAAAEQLRALRKEATLGNINWKTLRDEGRR